MTTGSRRCPESKAYMEERESRDLVGKSYDQMTHDDILREHGGRYSQAKHYTHWESTKAAILKFVGWMSAIFLVLYWLSVWLTPEKQQLAEKYQISQEAVSIAPK